MGKRHGRSVANGESESIRFTNGVSGCGKVTHGAIRAAGTRGMGDLGRSIVEQCGFEVRGQRLLLHCHGNLAATLPRHTHHDRNCVASNSSGNYGIDLIQARKSRR